MINTTWWRNKLNIDERNEERERDRETRGREQHELQTYSSQYCRVSGLFTAQHGWKAAQPMRSATELATSWA